MKRNKIIAMLAVMIAACMIVMWFAPAGVVTFAAEKIEIIYTENGHMLVEYPEVKADCTHVGDYGYRVEALQMKLLKAGDKAPASSKQILRKQQWSLINEDIDALFAVIIGWG